MPDPVDQILAEILDGTLDLVDLQTKQPVLFPGYADLVALAELLVRSAPEEELQALLKARPQLLFGAFGYGQNYDLAFITKPQIGTGFRADFAVLSYDQGGCDVYIIEIEPSSADLFTQDDTPARRLQQALGQVRDWDQWIRANRPTFIRDLVATVKGLPLYPSRAPNGSFLLTTPDTFEHLWRAFGGMDDPAVRYSVLIGRWSRLSSRHRERLLYMNRHDGALQQIRTFDQLARQAIMRPALRAY
jgi:hypothetical protein